MQNEWLVGARLHPKNFKKCGYTVFRYSDIQENNSEKSREMTQHIYDTEADVKYIADTLNLGARVWEYCDKQRRLRLEEAEVLQKRSKTKAANLREVSAAYADVVELISNMQRKRAAH